MIRDFDKIHRYVEGSRFSCEGEETKLAVDPISGEELDGIIHGLFKIKPETLAKLKEILNCNDQRRTTADGRPSPALER